MFANTLELIQTTQMFCVVKIVFNCIIATFFKPKASSSGEKI